MTALPESAIAAALAPLEVLPRQTPATPLQIRVYARALQDLSLHEIHLAVEQAVLSDAWYPTPAGLRAYARPRRLAVEAAAVCQAICALAHHDPASGAWWVPTEIEQVLGRAARDAFEAAGGSAAFRRQTEADLPWLYRRFGELYADYARWAEVPIIPPVAALRAIACGAPPPTRELSMVPVVRDVAQRTPPAPQRRPS